MTLDASHVATLSREEQAEALLPYVQKIVDVCVWRNPRVRNFRDELHSEALVGLAEALETYDPAKGDLPGYVISKVRFRISDFCRDNSWATMKTPRGTRARAVEEKAVPKWATSTPAMALTTVLREEGLQELSAAWGKLPNAQRELLQTLHYEGKTRVELARECGVTISAIDHRYLQAVKKLRLLMGVSSD